MIKFKNRDCDPKKLFLKSNYIQKGQNKQEIEKLTTTIMLNHNHRHVFLLRRESVAHPSLAGRVSAEVAEPAVEGSIRRTKRNFFDRLKTLERF